MEAVERMLRVVEVEFATLLTARVPPSCIADLKQKLGLLCVITILPVNTD